MQIQRFLNNQIISWPSLVDAIRWTVTVGIAFLSIFEFLPCTGLTGPFPDWRSANETNLYVCNPLLICSGMAYILLTCLYGMRRRAYLKLNDLAVRLADAFVIFGVLYGLGCLRTITGKLQGWPIMLAFDVLLLILLCMRRTHVYLLLNFMCVAIFGQCLIAIRNYVTGSNQFYTPNFGNRTSGSFQNPNDLYPLCLILVFVSIALFHSAPTKSIRIFYGLFAIIGITGLFLTFERTGFIGLTIGLVTFCLLYAKGNQRGFIRKARLVIPVFIVLLICLVGVLLRTHGSTPGSTGDRSMLGRYAIWRTAITAIAQHPIIGTGVGSFESTQSKYMTNELAKFNPRNTEAKSLYLNITVEMGLLGLAVLTYVAYRHHCVIMYLFGNSKSADDHILSIGIHSGLISLAVASIADTPILDATRPAAMLATTILLGSVCVIAVRADDVSSTSLLSNADE